ncbi:hypothetical protein D3C78_1110960 [compost metagenome]
MPGFCALAELDFDHLHLWIARLIGKAFGIKAASGSAATEVATANFPDQVAAMFTVIRADAAFTGVMGKAPLFRPLVECSNGVGAEGAEAHGRDVEDRG